MFYAELAAQALVQAALDAGGQDNASALVIRVTGLDTRQLQDELALGRRLGAPAALKVGEMQAAASVLDKRFQNDQAELNARLSLFRDGRGSLQDILEAAVSMAESVNPFTP